MEDAILLVEDNDDDVFLMRWALNSAGITNPVYVVEDGQDAIDYLAGTGAFCDRSKHPYPAIMFLDLKLPRKSGFDVLNWLDTRQDLTRPAIVVLSSSNAPQDMERASQARVCYAVKPPDADLFRRVTSEFGVVWLRAVAK